ncbi:hypothetical protein P280DRAFT_470942 [Massarina eburnea CBS 473.64]|uniref:MINDY deubiquitinase domain-containing protein n=1 Tax=Massarina eburnea CBS 473.64 TaxID=1395130 RepID=A0A6A6RUR6_9PLEO|nr:hypothetical protein P280DRAFT_470942 [Massarina eburnea CBS 473.64]
MVLRKNLPDTSLVPAPLSQAVNRPPYPTTPSDEHAPTLPSSNHKDEEVYSPDLTKSPAFNLTPLEEAQKKKEEDDSDYSDNEWDQSDDELNSHDLPGPLKIGGGKPTPAPSSNASTLPDVLRVGPPPGVAIKRSQEAITPDVTGATSSSYGAVSNSSGNSASLKTNNPYLKMQNTGQSNFGNESSHAVWGDAQSQAQTYGDLVELPTFQTPDTPTNHMADMNLDSNSAPAPSLKPPEHAPPPPPIAVEPATPATPHPPHEPNASESYDPGMDISSLDAFARSYGLPEDQGDQPQGERTWQEQQDWEKSERERRQREAAVAHENAVKADTERRYEEEYHRQDQASTHGASAAPPTPEESATTSHEEHPPVTPPRPINTNITAPSNTGPESPNTAMDRQRKETYQIKHIRWHDVNKNGMRTSPILTQNLNGPCPLLALVNALVLSTPAEVETALVETLRTREQVTLGLLLDAVFDELMSGRRGGAAQELPDVGELYRFLLLLHAGLNVNPVFVKDPDATDGTLALIPALTQRAGGFENTRDMKLYRTFNISLMHGWLPEPGTDAYSSFERIAKTYETSQYVQFQEEELDAKLQTGDALTSDEQQMFTDIHAIKEFLNLWPTQLTNYGLKTIRENLQPGQVAILFRNDHFSTLYKDPRTEHLVTLVTDQGYSTHDEIVWESLVDVTGQGSELFSGDFRPVGGNNNSTPQRSQHQPPVQSLLDADDNEGWTTVQSRRGNQNSSSSGLDATAPPASPSSNFGKVEQEDHDLALALQLQEEEDDQHRRATEERRRQENRLSENAIAAQSQARPGNRRTSRTGETPPAIPPRRNAPVNRPANEPIPPPTYEEASTTPQYYPPHGHPANQSAPVQPQSSAYQANSQGQVPHGRRSSRPMMPASAQGRPGRRPSGTVGPNGQEERDKCVVM